MEKTGWQQRERERRKNCFLPLPPLLHAALSSRAALEASCAASLATAATPSIPEGWPVASFDHRGSEEEGGGGAEEVEEEEEEEEANEEAPPPLLLLLLFPLMLLVLSREISKAPTARTFLKTTGIGA